MSHWKKLIIGILASALVVGNGSVLSVRAGDTDSDDKSSEKLEKMSVQQEEKTPGKVTMKTPKNKVPLYESGEKKDFVIYVSNKGETDIKNLVVRPVLDEDDSKMWPFKTDYQSYSAKISKLKAGEKNRKIKFTFTQRDDIKAGRYTIQFNYKADGGLSGSKSFYVNTSEKSNDNYEGTEPEGTEPTIIDNGGDDGSDVYDDGGDDGSAEGEGSVPRVIVTGFSTNPKAVRAGSNFTLTIHLRNTSRKTAVKNMLFDLNAPEEGEDEQTTAPAFLPASGSSTIFLDGIKANGTADISIRLNAKADLLQKPYSVELAMKYEDSHANAVENSSNISIPVKQEARFEFSDFEINPESIGIGDEANVMFSLYNLGRIKLYNVKAVFEGTCIEKEEVFVGNIESGATAPIDAMLEGAKETEGPAKVKMILSYENEDGEVTSEEKELELEVMESAPEEDMMAFEDVEEEGKKGIPLFAIILAAVVVIVAVIVIIRRKKKKKKMLNEEEELLYELDGSSEDEWE